MLKGQLEGQLLGADKVQDMLGMKFLTFMELSSLCVGECLVDCAMECP